MKILDTVLSSLTVACLASSVNAEILVGIAGPFSGSALAFGEQIEIGAMRAIDDINDNGGVLGQQIIASSADDACDSEQAKAAARQLVAEKVVFVVGHVCSSGSIAGGPIYQAENIIMISPASTSPLVTEAGLENVFRVVGRDDVQGVIAGDYLADNYIEKKIAILHDNSTYGKGLASITKTRLNERGVTEVMFDAYQPDQTEYGAIVEKLVQAEIDVIYIGGYIGDTGIILRQVRAKLPDIQLVSGDALAADGFTFIAGDAGLGAVFTFGPDARDTQVAADVVEAIREDEGFDPSGITLYSYAAVQAWAQAAEIVGSLDNTKITEVLHEQSFDTVLGKIGFDSKGDVTGIEAFIWYEITPEGYAPVN